MGVLTMEMTLSFVSDPPDWGALRRDPRWKRARTIGMSSLKVLVNPTQPERALVLAQFDTVAQARKAEALFRTEAADAVATPRGTPSIYVTPEKVRPR